MIRSMFGSFVLACALLWGPACTDTSVSEADDDDSATGDDDTAGDDDAWGDPDAQGPPVLDPWPDATNDGTIDLTGEAEEPGSQIRIYREFLVATTEADATTGAFSTPVGLNTGGNDFQVTATLDGLESWPASIDIDRCDPVDQHEANGGDSCADPIDLGSILDNGTLITLTGNGLEEGDEDWFTFVAADNLQEDIDAAADNWAVSIRFTRNDDDRYVMAVFRASCEAQECVEQTGYTEYDSTLDQTPCGGLLNECFDDTTRFFIRVFTADGSSGDCDAYTLSIRNG